MIGDMLDKLSGRWIAALLCSLLSVLIVGLDPDLLPYFLILLMGLGFILLLFCPGYFHPFVCFSAAVVLVLAAFIGFWSFFFLVLVLIAAGVVFLRTYLPVAEIQNIDWENISTEELTAVQDELAARYDDSARKEFLARYFAIRERQRKG